MGGAQRYPSTIAIIHQSSRPPQFDRLLSCPVRQLMGQPGALWDRRLLWSRADTVFRVLTPSPRRSILGPKRSSRVRLSAQEGSTSARRAATRLKVRNAQPRSNPGRYPKVSYPNAPGNSRCCRKPAAPKRRQTESRHSGGFLPFCPPGQMPPDRPACRDKLHCIDKRLCKAHSIARMHAHVSWAVLYSCEHTNPWAAAQCRRIRHGLLLSENAGE